MQSCTSLGIDVPVYLTFAPVETATDSAIDSKLQQIQDAGIHVIMLAGQRDDAKMVFRKAYDRGLTGKDYLWLGVDAWMANPIYDDTDNTTERAILEEATQGSIGLLPDIKGELLDGYIQNVWQG